LTRVLVLTTYDTDTDILHAVEAGAAGYLLKDTPHTELLDGIRAAARGETVLAPSVATKLVGRLRAGTGPTLSQRELEVLALVARGATNRQAAAELFISEATVKSHLGHILTKLDLRDRPAAIVFAHRHALV
jgi:DNA-binding NarL/FixJ family response regulator